MSFDTPPKTRRPSGRPPRRADGNKPSSLTVRLPGEVKNLLIDQAEATDLSVTDYICALVRRDAGLPS